MKSARAILDPEILNALREINGRDLFVDGKVSPLGDRRSQFLAAFLAWTKGRIPEFAGWRSVVTDGTTGAFQDFKWLAPECPLVVLRGEYPYHRMTGARVVDHWQEIPQSSKLILSHPFSATGNPHTNLSEILSHCDRNGVDVMIDSALLFVSSLDLDAIFVRPCVTAIALSLSKSFCTGRMRAGVCYTRTEWSTSPSHVLNEWSYLNHLSLAIHIRLMASFGVDYIQRKYRDTQLKICRERGFLASETVLFGLTNDESFREFSREGVINRLCLSEAMSANG